MCKSMHTLCGFVCVCMCVHVCGCVCVCLCMCVCVCVCMHMLQKRRKAAENSGEDEDEAAQELMTKHVQQRIAIIQGSQLNVDEELAQVSQEAHSN